MWATVAEFQAHGYAVPQFYGKWPFSSISFAVGPLVFLVQEPASTLFSLFNLCGCLWLWNELQTRLPEGAPLRRVWVGYSLVGIGAWICSMVFHSRDFWLTEYFDYFAAGALIFYAFFASLMVTIPALQRRTEPIAGRVRRHLLPSTFGTFCCIGLSVLTAGIYVAWALQEWYRGDYRPSINTLLLTIGIGLGAAVFEVFDFAPVFFWSVDAHSLFHLATVPTPILLGRFALEEAAHRRKGLLGKEA
ncbi:Post-GPI attachment to proteins factor 3 [Aphelenchoides fujianensis]|nr:Post-GPI attachment to proteins factor 3 [Aphelenchoides fujianensis]